MPIPSFENLMQKSSSHNSAFSTQNLERALRMPLTGGGKPRRAGPIPSHSCDLVISPMPISGVPLRFFQLSNLSCL